MLYFNGIKSNSLTTYTEEQIVALESVIPPNFQPRLKRRPWVGINDDALYKLIRNHNIYSNYARSSRIMLETSAAPLRERIHEKRRVIAEYSLFQASLVSSLLERFREQQLQVIPFKGPTLSALLYGDPAFRVSSDLDFLTRPEGLHRATRILIGAGFETGEWSGANRYHYKFVHSQYKVHLELHVSMLNKLSFGFVFPNECVWTRISSFTFAGRAIPVLHQADYFVYLCMHCLSHVANMELKWVADLFQFLSRVEDPVSFLEEIIDTQHLQLYKKGVLIIISMLSAVAYIGVEGFLDSNASLKIRKHGYYAAGRLFNRPKHLLTRKILGKYYAALAHKNTCTHLLRFASVLLLRHRGVDYPGFVGDSKL